MLLAALPITRVSFASIGIGDAVLLAGAVAVIVSPSRSVTVLSSIMMSTWHVQQGVLALLLLAGVFVLVGAATDKRKVAYIAVGVTGGLLAYIVVRLLLAPQYHGRADFLLQHIDRFTLRMLFYWPVGIAVALPGALALWLAKGRVGIHWSIWATQIVALAIGALTSDVSRVFFVLGFPAIFFAILRYSAHNHEAPNIRELRLLVPVLALSSAVPLLGWTGVEIFDWKGIANTLVKYGQTSDVVDMFLKFRLPYD